MSNTIARRYGKAIFELAVEANRFEQVGEELAALAKAMQESAELRAVLADPAIPQEARRAVVDALAANYKLDALTANVMRLMADRGRLHDLPALSKVYSDLVDKKVGRVRARVVSAIPLPDAEVARISEGLSKSTSRKVVVDKGVDPSILGGVVAQVGSLVFDGSLRTQLAELGRTLKGER